MAIDASDNLYILYYQANPKPEYYGGKGETQITKVNSSGVEQWTRVTGGQTPFMGTNLESAYDIHSSSGGRFTLLAAQTDTMENSWRFDLNGYWLFVQIRWLTWLHGWRSFTITATGNQPASNVALTLTSSDTGEMIPHGSRH